ncbi:MAG TPA: hypothetical protein VK694_03055 [Verrucomicrobiae bacterium]|nr:hypothetical protein [Verrucomicrobiae bacterium]
MIVIPDTGELRFQAERADADLLTTLADPMVRWGGIERIRQIHNILRDRRPDILEESPLGARS